MAHKSSASLDTFTMQSRYFQSEAEFHLEQARIHLGKADREERTLSFIYGFYFGAMSMIGLFIFLVMI